MAERSNAEYSGKTTESGHKHLLEQDLAQGKMHSEANFWMDMAKGALPAASESIDFRTGETWGALGQGAALGIGLSWMTNRYRPAPVRVIGGLINAGMALKFTWDSGQTVGQLFQLKDKAIQSGDYSSSVYNAQKLTGKFVADGAIGVLGAHIGFVGEHGIHHAMNRWPGKPRLAETVPIGSDLSGHVSGNPHDVSESPFYLAMSKARQNKKNQKRAEQKLPDAMPQPKVESTKSVEPANKVEAEKEIDLSPQTLKLLEEQAIRKGKPAAPEKFENLQALKQERDRETFRANKAETADLVISQATEKQAKFLTELEALRKSKNDEEMAETLLQSMDSAVEPHVVEARADRVLDLNNHNADAILAAAEKSPFIADLFLEARSGKYPADSHVVFVDDKGRLIRYSNDYVADRTFNYPVQDIGRGVTDFELMSRDIVKGAAIFGSPRGGDRPLLGLVGDVPAKLADCGNYREFFLTSRLEKNLSQFDFRRGIKQSLGDGTKCVGGICELEPGFLAKLKSSKEGALSQKSDVVEPAIKLADIVESVQATPRGGDEPLVKSETKVDPSPVAKLAKEEKLLRDQLASHEQSEIDGVKLGNLNKKQRKEIKRRLRDIEQEKEGLGLVVEQKDIVADVVSQTADSSVASSKPFDDSKIREMFETEREARLQGLPEGIYGRVSELEPSFKKQVRDARESASKPSYEQIRQEIEREARAMGLPDGVYGRYSEFKPGFKERFDEARNNYFERVAQGRKAKDATEQTQTQGRSETNTENKTETQTKSASETRAREERPQGREKKVFTQDDHDRMEVDLRIENALMADAFAAARGGSRSMPGDKIVFFAKDGDLITRVSTKDDRGYDKPMSTKLDFHFGNVPVELLKNEVIGWARAVPKVRDGEIVNRTNTRPGGNNKPQAEFEIIEVGGLVPPSMRRAVEEKIEVSQRDWMKFPEKALSNSQDASAIGSGNATKVDKLRKEGNNIKRDLDNHYRSVADGVDDGRLMSDKVDQLKIKLDKIEREIARNESKTAESTGAEKQAAKAEPESQEATSLLDKDALDPAKPREMKVVSSEKLTSDITRQLDSWKLQSNRPKVKPDNREPVPGDKVEALIHVAYNVYSRARELFVQGKAVEAEAWATSLTKLVEAEKGVFSIEDRIRAFSLLGESYRVQNKTDAADRCLQWTKNNLLSSADIKYTEQSSLLEAAVLESHAKVLRSEFSQERVQQARLLEARRRDILRRLEEDGHNSNADSSVWNKTVVLMRDRRTGQISMENNAKWLDRSLQILNWFNINL